MKDNIESEIKNIKYDRKILSIGFIIMSLVAIFTAYYKENNISPTKTYVLEQRESPNLNIAPLDIIKDDDIKVFNDVNKTILVKKDIMDVLNERFNIETNEFAYCLYGSFNSTAYIIEKIEEPFTKKRDNKSIVRDLCPINALGSIHSHPNGYCFISPRADFFKFGRENLLIYGVMCNNNTLKIMENTDLNTYLNMQVIG
ncbi:MAG: hypothetical protein AABY22_16620 [Nanoarchaeota archaeon]